MGNLDNVYEKSNEVEIDNNSKLVFISDVHRGDGTYYDSLLPNKNIYKTAISYYFRNGFTYVEVGDGDELWKNKNFNDIAYIYEDIFKILNKFKEKNRLYIIYGNHDIIKKNENFYIKEYRALRKIGADYGKEFLKFIKDLKFYEGIRFNYLKINESFLVTHGHQVDFINSTLWRYSRFLVRYVWKFLNGIAGFKDPTSPARNNIKGDKVDKKLEKYARESQRMIICGHTHNSRMPGKYEPPYFNDGCCVLPFAMTCIEIEKGKISLVKWSVEAQENGVLWVKRKAISAAQSLEEYLLWARSERIKINDLKEEERKDIKSSKIFKKVRD
ncbi:metallophosphoesterase [Clostridium sp.]|uniref:metallophosphoesterase n=1 Tax=Clostridium sp. TaxID=1506 RepID=UPI003F31E77C